MSPTRSFHLKVHIRITWGAFCKQVLMSRGFPVGSPGKEYASNMGPGLHPWVGKTPWRRERLPTPLFWPVEFHGLYSPRGHKESDTTLWLSLSLMSRPSESESPRVWFLKAAWAMTPSDSYVVPIIKVIEPIILGVQAHSDQWWGRDGRRVGGRFLSEVSSKKKTFSVYDTYTSGSHTKETGQRWQEHRFPNDTVKPRRQLALKSCLLLDFPMCEILYCLSHQWLNGSRLRNK